MPARPEPDKKTPPFWKSGWFVGILVVAVLHATGMLVHVQATLQGALLATGLFRTDLVEPDLRKPADLDFALRGRSGTTLRATDLAGDVLFINFWASWCPPCLAEMPDIDDLHDDYGDRVTFLMVSLDDDRDQAAAYLDQKRFGFEGYWPATRIPSTLTTGVLPTTVVVDRAGRIAVHQAGMASYDTARFRHTLDRLLAEPR